VTRCRQALAELGASPGASASPLRPAALQALRQAY
jgi:hypothetical protein